jgi:hypothetical protein
MLTDFRNRLTYFGTLDDVVYRYPWPKALDRRAIQHQLVTAAIYDKKILVNDGYLIANPTLLAELVDIDQSLIGNLLTSGTARLFARGGIANLGAGLEASAEKIATHREVQKDTKKWRQIRDQLDYMSGEVSRYTVAWPDDKNMGQLYYKLLSETTGMQSAMRASLLPPELFDDFDAIHKLFDSDIDHRTFDAARTTWERHCWTHFNDGHVVEPDQITRLSSLHERVRAFPKYPRVRMMMNVANDIYHLAYSVGALHAIQKTPSEGIDGTTIGMASSVMTAFPDLVGSEEMREPQAPKDRLHELGQLLITIPPAIKFTEEFSFATRMRSNWRCRKTREAYLAALADFIDGKLTFEEAIEACDDYINILAILMEPSVTRNFYETLLAQSLESAIERASAGLMKIIQAARSVEIFAEFALPIGLDHVGNLFVERLVRARIRAGFLQDGVEATQGGHDGSIRLARTIGLYMGPLTPSGAAAVVADVAPHPGVVKH